MVTVFDKDINDSEIIFLGRFKIQKVAISKPMELIVNRNMLYNIILL